MLRNRLALRIRAAQRLDDSFVPGRPRLLHVYRRNLLTALRRSMPRLSDTAGALGEAILDGA